MACFQRNKQVSMISSRVPCSPRAFQEMYKNTQTGIPIIRVAKDMPSSVANLTP